MRDKAVTGSWFAGMQRSLSCHDLAENTLKATRNNLPLSQNEPVPIGDITLADKMGIARARDSCEEDELATLKASLAQREAACLRIEGENFVLKAQVEQLQNNAQDVTKDVQSCQAYLAQAQQLLECVANGRMLHRTDVEPVRAVIAAARRSAKRAMMGEGSGRKPQPLQNLVSSESSAQVKSVKTPKLSPRGERLKDAKVASKERRSPGVARASSAGTGGTGSSEPAEPAEPAEPQSADSVHGNAPPNPNLLTSRGPKESGRLKASDENKPERFKVAMEGENTKTTEPQMAELKTQFARQRALLLAALKKGSQAEESMLSMKDDLTRKDVIIHNLKHDQMAQQQELQNQQQLFDSQFQLVQQQHQAQQLQQVKQYQELEMLLHAHMKRDFPANPEANSAMLSASELQLPGV